MPTYDYVCQDCGHAFDHFQSMSSDPLKDCPQCEKPALKRLIGSGGALIFKGSGFYCTDYKSPAQKKADTPATDAKIEKAKAAAKDAKASTPTPSGD